MARRPTLNPDEHPRPQVMVPMSIFGDPMFSSDYSRVGRWVHMWTHAVWKKDPTFRPFYEDRDEKTIELALICRWIVRQRGKTRLTGPFRDPKWLLDVPKKWTTYAIEAVGQGLVKVGHTIDVVRRLDELQVASPHELRLLGVIDGDYEKAIHREIRDHWQGGEWFALNDVTAAILKSRGLLK